MCKVYTGYHATSEIEQEMRACTANNALGKFRDYLSVQVHKPCSISHLQSGGGRVVRWCWVNFQCQVVLVFWSRVGQGSTALAVGAGGGCLEIFFSHLSFLFRFSLSLGDGPI